MPRGATTKIGDVFSVKLDDNRKKYFQYVANDLTQLNSDVIRAFKKTYSINASPDLSEVVTDEVDFYAHCITKWGIQLGFWERVGNIPNVGKVEVVFRSSEDSGTPEVKVSNNWWVWKINEEQKRVGKLRGENQKAEIGAVIPPDSIVHRMQTGKYDFVYPDFQ
jgi:hypothetical protein